MKKGLIVIVAIFMLFCGPLNLCAQDKAKDEAPVGMEYIMVGDARILVPKGTHIRKQGDLNVVEDVGQYSSRKFVDIDARLDKLEADQKTLAEEIAKIRETVGK